MPHSQLNSSQSLFLGIAVTFGDRRAVTAQVQQQGDISPDNRVRSQFW
ncbi:hypothetical protein QUA20_12030 [Microcoleus sp. Pol7_A1]